MLQVLELVLDKSVDDLLIYSKTKAEHLQLIRTVLAPLPRHNLCAKLSKCSFMQDETEFLGHTITKEGIKTLDRLTRAIRDWPTTKSTLDVQQFLVSTVLVPFCRNCPPSFLPPSSLLANNTPFTWTDTQQAAFLHLQRAICSAPILCIFDPSLATIIDTDASGFALGGVLLQTDQEGKDHLVAFHFEKATIS